MTQYTKLTLSAVCLLSSAIHLSAENGQWKISSGVDFSSGDYGSDETTEIWYVPVNLSYAQGPWQAKVTVPWIQIKGPGNVVGAGDGGIVIPGGDDEVTTESGIGDIWTSLTYSVEAIPADLLYLDVVGKVKVPTADEDKGLGTGEVDYTLQFDLFKPLGKLTPMFTLAYKFKGDPDEYDLNDVFYLSGGADYRYSDEMNFGATLDFQEASTDSADDSLEIFSYLSYDLDEQWKLTAYTHIGLSDGSPDAGGGLSFSYSL